MTASNPLDQRARPISIGTPEEQSARADLPLTMSEAETFRPIQSDDATFQPKKPSDTDIAADFAKIPSDRRQAIWSRLKADSAAYHAQQNEQWLGIDEALLANYLAGHGSDDDRRRMEAAISASPALQQCAALLRGLTSESPDSVPAPTSAMSAKPRFNSDRRQLRLVLYVTVAAIALAVAFVCLWFNH